MTDSAEKMREAIKRFHRNCCYPEAFDFEVDGLMNELAALSASGTKSDGGVESRHAKTGNMSGAVPEEEQSLPASGFVRAFGPEDKTSKPRDGVAPIPSDPIPSRPDERPVCKLCGLEDGACICRSIPKQPQPDEVEAIAETIWRAEYRRATGRERSIPWSEVSSTDRERYRYVAAAILAMQAERRGVKP
jgi:hypothetical protein